MAFAIITPAHAQDVARNVATITPPDGVVDADTSNNTAIDEDPIVSVLTSKSSNPVSGQLVGRGSVIEYTLSVTVTGGPLPVDVVLTDTLSDGLTLVPGSLPAGCTSAAGAGGTTVVTCTLVAGTPASATPYAFLYSATVDADAVGPVSNVVEPSVGDCSSCSTSHTVELPSQTLEKTLIGQSADPVVLGTVLTYTITLTNTGTATTFDTVTVSDPILSPNSATCADVAPGGTCVLTGTYTVTQADVDNGEVVNAATSISPVCAVGTDPGCSDTVTTPIDQDGALTSVKTVTSTGPYALGETIDYAITVTNTGTITLDNVVVSDPQLTPATITCATVVPGATCVLAGSYVVTQADVDNGEVVNTATVETDTPDVCPAGSAAPECHPTVTTPVLQEIVAVDDDFGPVNGADGGDAGNAYDNDTFNGQPVDPSTIVGTIVTPATPVNGGPVPVMDPVTGHVSVPPGTPAGSYEIVYQMCLAAAPTVCDTATVTVVVAAPEIDAVDDSFGPVNGSDGVTTPSVLNNDTLNGVPVVPADIVLTPGVSPNPGLVMNPDGTITVAPGTPTGVYPYPYAICDVLSPTNCDEAVALVEVIAPAIDAVDDVFPPVGGGGTTPSVLDNDTLNGAPVVPGEVTLIPGASPDPGLVMNPGGTITVDVSTPVGTYEYPYTICEIVNPTNCDTAIAIIVVEPPSIDAADDAFAPISGGAGGTTPSVLDNDTLNGAPVVPAEVTLTPGASPATGLQMNPGGTITVSPETVAGTYEYPYTICEVANPDNCDSAVATVVIEAVPAIEATKTAELTVDNGTTGVGNVGDVITYGIVVRNAGNTMLEGLVVTDVFNDGTPTALVCTPTSLAPGETAVCDSYTHTITAEDATVEGGQLENRVIATATSTSGGADPVVVTVSDTSAAVVEVEAEPTTIRIIKQANPRDVHVGDLVRYTLRVENTGAVDLIDGTLVDTPPAGFTYVDGSLTVADRDGAGRLVGTYPIRVDQIDIAAGGTATVTYLLRVGAGVRTGIHTNSAFIQQLVGGNEVPVSNVATADVQLIGDPLLDDSLIVGTVFDDRDGDGWQDSAEMGDVRVQGGFAPGAYVANSTTVDRGNGPAPEADASSPLLHGIAIGTIEGRQSEADPVERRQVVVSQLLNSPDFTDFTLTTKQGVTLRMDAAGNTRIERNSGDAAKGLTAAEPTVERRVSKVESGYRVDYVIGNAGVDERGIPGVRIATVEGLLVETDPFGRFHLVGVEGGRWERGRNFVMKVDPASVPPGSEFTTDNPLVRRITPGLPVRFDFGVKLPQGLIEGGTERSELEMGEVFFAPGSAEVRAQYLPVIEVMAAKVREYQGGEVVINANGDTEGLAYDRANAVKAALLGMLDEVSAKGLVVSARGNVSDPGSMVVGVDEGGALLGTVLFDTDKSTIRPEFEPLLDRVAAALEQMGGGSIAIVGHTDIRASHAYNVALGMRRATAVYEALARRLGPEAKAKLRVEASNDPTAPVGERK